MITQPLQADMINKAAFVNSLFSSDVRDPQQNSLLTAISQGAISYDYADPGSRGLILGAWLAAWQAHCGDPYDVDAYRRCPQQDFLLIEFLSDYLRNNPLDLCMPALAYDHLDSSGFAVYRNSGYERQAFLASGAWLYGAFDSQGRTVGDPAEATVARFLNVLFDGAHIVSICSDKDGGGGIVDLLDALGQSQLATATDLLNSHYGGSGTLSGSYYAAADGPEPSGVYSDHESLEPTKPPGGEPLAFSLLFGVTATTNRNVFLQLEGWPSQRCLSPPGGQRHNADYDANEATLWNFSTYGACAYSEKRSTPIFLANSLFDLTIHPDTGMPYYWGANAGNVGDGWMHPQLLIPPVAAIATITSSGQPQPGQTHRSSANFSLLGTPPPGNENIRWVVTGNGNAANLSFDVMQDKSGWSDPTIWSNLHNQQITDYQMANSFYIANPQNTGGNPFTVEVFWA